MREVETDAQSPVLLAVGAINHSAASQGPVLDANAPAMGPTPRSPWRPSWLEGLGLAVLLVLGFQPGGIFMLLPAVSWLLVAVLRLAFTGLPRAARHPSKRQPRAWRPRLRGVVLAALACIAIGLWQDHLQRDVRAQAESARVQVQAFRRAQGRYPSDAEAAAWLPRKPPQMVVYLAPTAQRSKPLLMHRAATLFDRYYYNFETETWDFVPD